MSTSSTGLGLLSIIFIAALAFVGYVPQQDDFSIIISGLSIAFGAYVMLYRMRLTLYQVLALGTFARLVLVFAMPNLSDDIYRFIWDGRMMHIGMSPYSALPSEMVNVHTSLSTQLFELLNSPNYYTIYPPITQAVNYLSTLIVTQDFYIETIIYKLLLLLFELLGIYYFIRLSRRLKWSTDKLCLFYLNPLLIIEVMGNCHFEGVMITFIIIMLYYLNTKQYGVAGVTYTLSILSKVLPLLFGPLLLFLAIRKKIGWSFFVTAAVTFFLFVIPTIIFNADVVSNITNSVDLYVRSFEFNGSIYYLLRFIGYQIVGFNLIHILGPLLSLITLLLILRISHQNISHKTISLSHRMLLIYMVFILLSRTIHPWYSLMPLLLGSMADYRYPILWTYMISWTYINYSYPTYQENMMVVGVEYVLLAVSMGWELIQKKPAIE